MFVTMTGCDVQTKNGTKTAKKFDFPIYFNVEVSVVNYCNYLVIVSHRIGFILYVLLVYDPNNISN